MDACYLLLSRRWLFGNNVIYDGHVNTYSLKDNGYSLTLTPLVPPKPLAIKLMKGREKSLHKSETRDESFTSKSKPRIALLMVKPNTSEVVNHFYPMASILPMLMVLNSCMDSLLRDPYQATYL